MGILNVTPDSFSDGGNFFDTNEAIDQAYQLIESGADIIDVGGESSRPGAEPVPEEQEINRVNPIIEEIAGKAGHAVSIDTVKYNVALKAINAGACIINDISGLQQEPRFADLAAQYDAGLILMHMRGTPQTMQDNLEYDDLIKEINDFFSHQVKLALAHGVKENHLVLDPGLGFSKDATQNLHIINELQSFKVHGYPLLLGVSRKSFIGKITGKIASERLMGTAAAVTACILNGAEILRIHDVEPLKDVIHVADAIYRQKINLTEEESNTCG